MPSNPPLDDNGNGLDFWDERRGRIRSRKGGWVIGEAVHSHGYSIMEDLVGRRSFSQVLVLNVTGRLPERRLADWYDAVLVCLSWPDARIWCNQVASLGGSLRVSPVAAVAAGLLASDSRMYGPGTALAACSFITAALRQYQEGATVETIIRGQQPRPSLPPVIVGYGRPVASGDERVAALLQYAERLGFAVGDHLGLALAIEKSLLEHFGESMNLTGYYVAFLCDQGLSADEIYRLSSILVNAGVHACYAEAADQPPESFLPMRCADFDYQGQGPRPVPERG
ncbi:MAG: hypothetical protein AB1568_09560 [Thermodesulfobacteriota bacterium]